MNLFKKWRVRRKIISKIKKQDLSIEALKQYIKYISLYYSGAVDEDAVYCSVNNITGVHELTLNDRSDIGIDISLLGNSIFLKVILKDGNMSVENGFGFVGKISYDSIMDKPITDWSNTIESVIEILCNSILYTIKYHTKSWWKNEESLRDSSK